MRVAGDAALVVSLEEKSLHETREAVVRPAAERQGDEVGVVSASELREPGAQVDTSFESIALELVEHEVTGLRVEVFELERHGSPFESGVLQ